MDARTPREMSTFNKLLALLVIVGAITWGLIGLFEWNLVAALFGGEVRSEGASSLSQLVYILVGLAGVAFAFTVPWRRRPVNRGEVRS